MLVVSLKSSSCLEFDKKKIVLNFAFSEEFSMFKILCEQVIFGMILFTFRWIFIQIKISIKIVIQNYISLVVVSLAE